MAARNRLSTKVLLMVEAIILISSILFCAVAIYRARIGIRKAIQQRMLDIANCAAGSVSGDVLESINEDEIGSEGYNSVYNTLTIFRDNVDLEYVYAIKEDGNGGFIFILDTDPLSPAGYGDVAENTTARVSAANGTASVDETPYTDEWGEFYSAYGPVYNSNGEVVGIVAADFSVEWFEDQVSAQTRSTVITYIIILIFTQLVAAMLSFLIVKPYVKAQGELIEEKARAESANNAKSDFLANMSHEIRTPINAVLGMNEMILREGRRAQELSDNDTQARKEAMKNIVIYAGDVENAGHNLLALVNDILDFSKIEAGEMDLMESPYQLSSMLNDLSNMTLFKARDKGLEFVIDVDETLPDELFGDEMRVKQIFTNILNNAVKYTEHGNIRFKLRGEKQADGMIALIASVRDTGIGIKTEDREKLFDMFQRLEIERNSTIQGSGLGLSITQRLLDMMNGSISVESEYGKGSTFTVTIPQKIVKDVPVGDFQKRFEENVLGAGVYRESFRAPDAHILIVDDTKMNLTVVVNLLKNTNMKIDTAYSGPGAIALAEMNKYDLILMDQRMPEMDGTEAFHLIRESEGGASKDSPVICLTADAVVGAKERYLAEGFTDFLTKPIDSYALEKMLIKHLPKEKVECVIEDQDQEIDSPNEVAVSADLSSLVSAGIDPKIGLPYCQNDEAFYRSMLNEYAHSKIEREAVLKKSFSESDWKTYAIHVHSLKSTSKMIGALALSEQAAKLEAAANAGDGNTIRYEHDSMMQKYEDAVNAIKSLGSDADSDSGDDDEIMEFLPDSN
ncbi:Hpt domain-containing protein [Ruminococcaceae bacterium YAD3003]|nr:Hpt domain-containing protein [Ruminococcaceae bacterium YAD3003]